MKATKDQIIESLRRQLEGREKEAKEWEEAFQELKAILKPYQGEVNDPFSPLYARHERNDESAKTTLVRVITKRNSLLELVDSKDKEIERLVHLMEIQITGERRKLPDLDKCPNCQLKFNVPLV